MATLQYEVTCPSCRFNRACGQERPYRNGFQSTDCSMCGYSIVRRFSEDAFTDETQAAHGTYMLDLADGRRQEGRFPSVRGGESLRAQVNRSPEKFRRASLTEKGPDGVWRRTFLVGEPEPGDDLDSRGGRVETEEERTLKVLLEAYFPE